MDQINEKLSFIPHGRLRRPLVYCTFIAVSLDEIDVRAWNRNQPSVAAMPFFWRTAVGDLFYVAMLFGSFRLAEWKILALREPSNQPALT